MFLSRLGIAVLGAAVSGIIECLIADSDGSRDGYCTLRGEVSRRKSLVINEFMAKVTDVTDNNRKKQSI